MDLILIYSVFSCSVYLLTNRILYEISDLEAEFSSVHSELAYTGMKNHNLDFSNIWSN